ncbi:hypothetical protein [Kitasatospora sp. GP82]|uniref:hypothetical protein n=1 Tax=Kitasatospora sp. GP82 TaxID=3035089 RepID=UPI002475F971|nr:hypothetical protein [Kitasatospora sp. GP82]MDH6123381.1 hypothetical protein [Kitasatospora sp. GP82]
MRSPIRRAVAALAVTAAVGGFGVTDAVAAPSAPAAVRAPAGPMDTDPSPSCNDNNNTVPCWEYQTWYWTYENCNNAGPGRVSSSGGRYDHWVCVLTGNGVGVGLWLHKVRD